MPRRRRNDGFQTSSFTEFLTRPLRLLGRWFSRDDHREFSMDSQRSFGEMLLSWLTLPIRLIWAVITFMVQSWAISRQLMPFLLGVPAILAASGLMGGLWAANFLHEKQSVNATRAYFQLHTQRSIGDDATSTPEDALIFAEKLVELKPDDDEAKFYMATARERADDLTGARDVINYLIRPGQSGYPPAHVWLARHELASGNSGLGDQERDETIKRNLAEALEQEPNNARALLTQAEFHRTKASRMNKDSDEYQFHLQEASSSLKKILEGPLTMMPIQSIPMMVDVQRKLGLEDEAKRFVDAIMEKILPYARKNVDQSEIWQTLVSCALQLDDYELANRIIFQGMQIAQSDQAQNDLKRLSTLVLVKQIDDLKESKNAEQYRKKIELISQAVMRYPRERSVYKMLSQLVIDHAQPEFNDNWLRGSVVDTPFPAIVHILVGFDDIISGNVLEGQIHWRIAESQFSLTPAVVYNLIHVIIIDRPESIPKLLDAVTLAIEMFPEYPLMYFARGVYFQQQGQWRDAIDDMHQALDKVSGHVPHQLMIHKRLAECYRHIEEDELAAEQDKQFESIINQFTPARRILIEQALERTQ